MLHDLKLATCRTSDERVFAALLDLIGDRGQPRALRVSALESRWCYGDNSMVDIDDHLLHSALPRAVVGMGTNIVPRWLGARPVEGDVRVRIAGRTGALAAAPGDDELLMLAFKEAARYYGRPK